MCERDAMAQIVEKLNTIADTHKELAEYIVKATDEGLLCEGVDEILGEHLLPIVQRLMQLGLVVKGALAVKDMKMMLGVEQPETQQQQFIVFDLRRQPPF